MKLIDKDVLVAEIEKRRDAALIRQHNLEAIGQETVLNEMEANELNRIISFINTLEVKEDNLFTETKIEKELAEAYINIFDKKFGNKLPNLKGTRLHDFKNFINTCEQTFSMKYFDYHATQGKLFEKLALLWAVWGAEHLNDMHINDKLEDVAKKLWSELNTGHSYSVIDSYNIFYGICLDVANWQREQMMKDATECEVKVDAGGYPYIDRCIELYDYDKDIPLAKEGDKVKVIIVKDET